MNRQTWPGLTCHAMQALFMPDFNHAGCRDADITDELAAWPTGGTAQQSKRDPTKPRASTPA